MTEVFAAGLLALIGVFDFVFMVGSGWLSERYDNRWLLFWYYGLRGISLLFLPFSGFTLYGLSIFAVFYGLDWVATVPPTVDAAYRFGRERANLVFGWIFVGHRSPCGHRSVWRRVLQERPGQLPPGFLCRRRFASSRPCW